MCVGRYHTGALQCGLFSRAARSVWGGIIQEHFNVDSSREMNDLASFLLRGGDDKAEVPIKSVSYRQFLPASHTVCTYFSHCNFIFNLTVYRCREIEQFIAVSYHYCGKIMVTFPPCCLN
jgi:hypothetical protein